jgi:hypothetical protein
VALDRACEFEWTVGLTGEVQNLHGCDCCKVVGCHIILHIGDLMQFPERFFFSGACLRCSKEWVYAAPVELI